MIKQLRINRKMKVKNNDVYMICIYKTCFRLNKESCTDHIKTEDNNIQISFLRFGKFLIVFF